ncbi:FAD-dependent oxidoreductase [Candidatus Omnitrophota bacterium]
MEIVKGKFIQRIKRTRNIESFRFSLDKKVNFIPGQFLQVIFDEDTSSNKELNKYLSFSSSPAKDYIEVTKRLSESQFSQKLKDLKIGDEVSLKAPFGNCVYKDEYKKIGFLIGGIGITPVISIIEYIVDKKLDTDVLLLYSNKTEEDIAFKKELDSWRSVNSNIKAFYTITECEPADKNCIAGRIDKNLFINKIKDYCERMFFIFGPPRMVGAMQNLCLETGCSKDCVKAENFVGY